MRFPTQAARGKQHCSVRTRSNESAMEIPDVVYFAGPIDSRASPMHPITTPIGNITTRGEGQKTTLSIDNATKVVRRAGNAVIRPVNGIQRNEDLSVITSDHPAASTVGNARELVGKIGQRSLPLIPIR